MVDERLSRLRAEIEVKQYELAAEQRALDALQGELAEFAAEYDQLIGTLEAELDAVRQQIEQLEQLRQTSSRPFEFGAGGYTSFDDYIRDRYTPNNPKIVAPPEKGEDYSQDDLRTLYRKLARRFHPDTTTDSQERARLTVLMAQINAAYRAKDLDELRALASGNLAPTKEAEASSAESVGFGEPVKPVGSTYTDLLEQLQQLEDDIFWTRSMYNRVKNGPLMSLKIESSLARSKGRNLLQEIATKIRGELKAAQSQLNQLQSSR